MERITNTNLQRTLSDMVISSNGAFAFEEVYSQHRIFFNGRFFAQMRRTKVLAFCEGWTMRDNLVHKETPETLNGLNIQSGVVMVMMQLKDTDIIYAGDKARGEYRGFAALHDLMDANMLLPYTAKFSSSDEHALAYWTKLMNQVTIVLCNIWDVRNEAQLKKQNALQSRK